MHSFKNHMEESHIPGQSNWTPAVKTTHHYQGQINGKTFVVPHSSVNIYRKGGYAAPMRHAIVTSLHHVQHNNPDLSPEEVTRVHQHIKDLHGGQDAAGLKEDTMLQEGRPIRGDVFHHHQTLIAKKTLHMHDAAVSFAGGPSKEEARAHLKKMGWTEKQVHDHEQLAEGADALKRPFRKHRMQETNPFKVGDKVKLHPEALKHHAQSVPAHAGYSKEGFAWREHLGKLEGHVGTVSRVFDSGHTNVDFHSGTIGIEHKSLVAHHDPKKLDEVNLGLKDHRVIKSFLNGEKAEGKKLSSDGKQLNGNWLGGNRIAHHDSGKVHLNDLGSKSGEQVHRAIRRHAPSFQIHNESVELQEHGYVGFDHKGNRHEVHSDTLYGAIKTIREKAKTPKSQHHKVHASLAERDTPEGAEQVVHTAVDESSNFIDNERTGAKIQRRQKRAHAAVERRDDVENKDRDKSHQKKVYKTVKSVIAEATKRKALSKKVEELSKK